MDAAPDKTAPNRAEFVELVGMLFMGIEHDDGHAAHALRFCWPRVHEEYERRIQHMQSGANAVLRDRTHPAETAEKSLERDNARLAAEVAALRGELRHCEIAKTLADNQAMGHIHTNELLRKDLAALKAQPGWVPCAERLPELGITVLFYDAVISKGCREMFNKGEAWIADTDIDGMPQIGVTHWMPLPEPPLAAAEGTKP